SGIVSVAPAVTLTNGGALTLANPNEAVTLAGGGELKNTGTIAQAGAAPLQLSSPAPYATRLTNLGVYDFKADTYVWTPFSTGTFTNTGTVRKSAGTGPAGSSIYPGVAFNSSGLIDVRVGLLEIGADGGVCTGGTFDVEAGATLNLAYTRTVSYQGTYTGTSQSATPGTVLVSSSNGTLKLA